MAAPTRPDTVTIDTLSTTFLTIARLLVVVLRHFAGLAYDEIGVTVGVPARTVKKSRLYATALLKDLDRDHGFAVRIAVVAKGHRDACRYGHVEHGEQAEGHVELTAVILAIRIGGGVAIACLVLHEWIVSAGVPRTAVRYYLQLVGSECFGATRFGSHLYELKERFGGPIVADMFCLLRVELELSVRAKAMLLAHQAGLRVPVDDDLYASLAELEYLRSSIGPTDLLALKPLQVTSHRDEWHRYLLRRSKKPSP